MVLPALVSRASREITRWIWEQLGSRTFRPYTSLAILLLQREHVMTISDENIRVGVGVGVGAYVGETRPSKQLTVRSTYYLSSNVATARAWPRRRALSMEPPRA